MRLWGRPALIDTAEAGKGCPVTPGKRRLARLRGGLAAVEVGARGIESVARNTACTRLRAIVIAGLTPSEVIKKVFKAEVDAMSPFAMTLTQNFERGCWATAAHRC